MSCKVLIIDNFDSYTYNLVQLIKESGYCTHEVIKTDKINMDTPEEFDGILISPGPGTPSETPILEKVIRCYEKEKSILGICLGHQAIAESYGGHLYNMEKVFHGIKESIIVTDPSETLFKNIPDEFHGGLYHSWAVEKDTLPQNLKITAVSSHGVVMALAHKYYDVKGIQFHPESYMTGFGRTILYNWLDHLDSKTRVYYAIREKK